MQKEFLIDLVSWLVILVVLSLNGCVEQVHDAAARGRLAGPDAVIAVNATTPSPLERIVVVSQSGAIPLAPKKAAAQTEHSTAHRIGEMMSTGAAFPRLLAEESVTLEQDSAASGNVPISTTNDGGVPPAATQESESESEDKAPMRLTQLRFDRPEEPRIEPSPRRVDATATAAFHESRSDIAGTWTTALITAAGIILTAMIGFFLTMRRLESRKHSARDDKPPTRR